MRRPWSMVLNSDGVVGDTLELRNIASKGKGGGRIVPLNTELRAALVDLHADRRPAPRDRISHSERGGSVRSRAKMRENHKG